MAVSRRVPRFGFLAGSTTGSGVILLSLLMAVGMSGVGVVATDLLSTVTGVTRLIVYSASGVMTGRSSPSDF